jgi:hypothetical protein
MSRYLSTPLTPPIRLPARDLVPSDFIHFTTLFTLVRPRRTLSDLVEARPGSGNRDHRVHIYICTDTNFAHAPRAKHATLGEAPRSPRRTSPHLDPSIAISHRDQHDPIRWEDHCAVLFSELLRGGESLKSKGKELSELSIAGRNGCLNVAPRCNGSLSEYPSIMYRESLQVEHGLPEKAEGPV